MPFPIAAVGLGLQAVGALGGLFRRQKKYDNRRAIAELRSARPTGYLLPQDYQAAGLTQSKLAETAQASGDLAGTEANRRARARGLTATGDIARIEENTALNRQRAGEAAQEQLYNTSQGREAFGRQKALDIFAAETGQAQQDQARQDAENGQFWNSVSQEFIPSIMASIPKGPSAVAPTGEPPGAGLPEFAPTSYGAGASSAAPAVGGFNPTPTRRGGGVLPAQRGL